MVTRREYLETIASSLLIGIAGCSGGNGGAGEGTDATTVQPTTATDMTETTAEPTATSTSEPTTTGEQQMTTTATETTTEPTTTTATTTDSGTSATIVEVAPDGEFIFEPGTNEALTIPVGTTVEFVWKSGGHNIVVGSQPADANWTGTPGGQSQVYDKGYRYEHTFEVAGKYHYWCQPHKSIGMAADIVVNK
ncbi:MAG: plastocyanin/azurin family copper-binding protein [Halobacteriales archaeon]